ncbi:glycoside hydrolase family 38 N-terminal domain-containing protein [Cohnella nanjingensis]|uniref:Alpha-mannosidase n=1 Tax=Cohnella nanjingensis TaxID=1387779 RepID=A0A7X0RNP6_9BACL|nr:alpha-mannosidase [Cohnella nanjingensis]MBB6670887.1 alpha-mannosidase [Cohnella nanjingensis]
MHAFVPKLQRLNRHKASGYWPERILTQLEYAYRLSKVNGGRFDSLLEEAVDYLTDRASEEGVITRSAAVQAEGMIAGLSAEAKKLRLLCTAHAHIDMNWQWGWDETVQITLDTFRTVLDLMEEYPSFTFSQSQAAIYRIVEEYAPEMLPEIKQRVKEGRWEVTASHWVEADKNMPNGESLSRHLLYTRRYLSKLLDIPPESLNIDFEPDTFGHSANVPEILADGGVRYYYHCRGYEGHHIYRWVAPSGKSVIAYREPIWYNAYIEYGAGLYVPEFCANHNMTTMLKVYGIGDHGGGPTRRDIERLLDMATWPVYPTVEFGTYAQFFALVEQVADQLPVVQNELNFVFSGCYTSQSRIKLANRTAEAALYEAEALGAIAHLRTGAAYRADRFEEAWRNVLFAQFHDILPGSGVTETREHALGMFQNTMATTNSARHRALRALSDEIDTSKFISDEPIADSISEGAGVGYGSKDFKVSQVGRGRGGTRIFHIYNTTPVDREEVAEFVLWDWNGNISHVVFEDDEGRATEHQIIDHGFNHYWSHYFLRALVKVSVPALGYSTYVMRTEAREDPLPFQVEPRLEKVDEFVLENERIRVVFHPVDASIVSFVDKESGEELIDPGRPSGIFRFVQEDFNKGMSAWIVGRYMEIQSAHGQVRLSKRYDGAGVRQAIRYEMSFGDSKLAVEVSLDAGSSLLGFEVECDWQEIGKAGLGIPQMHFHLPFAYDCDEYVYDIPFGTVVRGAREQDVPANGWAFGRRKEGRGRSFMLLAGAKHGFRGADNSLSVTLLRSSYDPDPHPELGVHRFRFAIALALGTSNRDLIEFGRLYHHPLHVLSDIAREGRLPATYGMVGQVTGNVAVSAIKLAEDGSGDWIVRLYETEGAETEAGVRLPSAPRQARLVDMHELSLPDVPAVRIDDDRIAVPVAANTIANIRVTF